jgi:hypothetical protein
MASIDVYRCGVFFCPACRVGFYALFRRVSLCRSWGPRLDGDELFLSRLWVNVAGLERSRGCCSCCGAVLRRLLQNIVSTVDLEIDDTRSKQPLFLVF